MVFFHNFFHMCGSGQGTLPTPRLLSASPVFRRCFPWTPVSSGGVGNRRVHLVNVCVPPQSPRKNDTLMALMSSFLSPRIKEKEPLSSIFWLLEGGSPDPSTVWYSRPHKLQNRIPSTIFFNNLHILQHPLPRDCWLNKV